MVSTGAGATIWHRVEEELRFLMMSNGCGDRQAGEEGKLCPGTHIGTEAREETNKSEL